MKDIADMIFYYRREMGVKSSEFAKQHGISRATLWRIENRKTTSIPIKVVEFLLRMKVAEYYKPK